MAAKKKTAKKLAEKPADPRDDFGPRPQTKEFGIWMDSKDYQRLSNAMWRADERAPGTFALGILLAWLDAHPEECRRFPEQETPEPAKPYVPFESDTPFSVGDLNWKPTK